MTYSNVRLADSTKKILDKIKDTYTFNTYESCVYALANFIVKNEIDPTDAGIGNFKNSLVDLEMRISKNIAISQKQLNADNISLRKWVGAIERDYLLPIKKNLDVVDKFVNFNIESKFGAEIKDTEFINPINENLKPAVDKYNNDDKLKALYKQILDSSSKVDELEREIDNQKKTLNIIFNAAKIEQGGMLSKSKIIIEMDVEYWESLKKF